MIKIFFFLFIFIILIITISLFLNQKCSQKINYIDLEQNPIYINSNKIILPESYHIIEKAGIKLNTNSLEEIVPANLSCVKNEYIKTNSLDANVSIYFFNPENHNKKLSSLEVTGFSIDFNEINDFNISLPNNINLNSTKKELISSFGVPNYIKINKKQLMLYWRIDEDTVLRVKYQEKKIKGIFVHSLIRFFFNDNLKQNGNFKIQYKILNKII